MRNAFVIVDGCCDLPRIESSRIISIRRGTISGKTTCTHTPTRLTKDGRNNNKHTFTALIAYLALAALLPSKVKVAA